MPLFPEENPNSLFFSRHDEQQLFGSASEHGFQLDDESWPTVEHYFQAHQFTNADLIERIKQAPNAQAAIKVGKWRFWQKKKGWKARQQVLMTRALYTKARTHPEVAQALLDTQDQTLVENSNYDYFWGCGRDRRGLNTYGQVAMNVREKLKQENKQP